MEADVTESVIAGDVISPEELGQDLLTGQPLCDSAKGVAEVAGLPHPRTRRWGNPSNLDVRDEPDFVHVR